jgi:adenylate cyclase
VLAAALAAARAGALFLAGRIARPVRALAAAMDRAGKGTLLPVSLRSADEVGQLAASFNTMVHGLKERERLQSTLSRYVSDDVAARILTEQSDLDLQGELRDVTVLFLDVRGFSDLSRLMPPRDVVALLNTYFEVIIEVIFKHHGTVSKFIGDAIMAVWGAPFAVEDAPMRAVRTAAEIQQRVSVLNQERRERGQPTIDVGIGVHSGAAIAGNLGSERRMEYAVVGDEVSLAQRLEASAEAGQILLTQATFERVRERVESRERAPMQIKGRAAPIWTYEVIGLKG